MKNNTLIIGFTFMTLFNSCTDIMHDESWELGDNVKFVGLLENSTLSRVHWNEDESGNLLFNWDSSTDEMKMLVSSGSEFKIFQSGNSFTELNVSPSIDNRLLAYLNTEDRLATEYLSGDKIFAFSPVGEMNINDNICNLTMEIPSDVIQTIPNNTTHLKKFAFIKGSGEVGKDSETAQMTFHTLPSIIRFKIKNTSYTQFELSGVSLHNEKLCNKINLSIDAQGNENIENVTCTKIGVTYNNTIQAQNSVNLYTLVFPSDIDKGDKLSIILDINANGNIKTFTDEIYVSRKMFESNNVYTITIETDGNNITSYSSSIDLSAIDTEHFPFDLVPFSSEINIASNSERPFSNKQLCLNMGFQVETDALKGFDAGQSKLFTRWYKPVSLRFPQGAWGNFYNWETDGRSKYEDYEWDNGTFDNQMNENVKFGINGFAELHKELNFGILWVWNINYKYEGYAINRLNDHLEKGLEVKDIELGNELFWKTQRSSLTSDEAAIVRRAEKFADSLSAKKNDLRFSLPFSWRRGEAADGINHDSYNKKLSSGNTDYFDAMSLHRYIHTPSRNGVDDNPGEEDEEVGGNILPQSSDFISVLTARNTFKSDAEYLQGICSKPIWLSEWGVSCGNYAASYLGMADSYLYFFENPEIFEYVAWFQTHGGDDFFLTSGTIGNPVYTKTGYGAVYEIIRSVFEGSSVLDTDVTAPFLVDGVKAVSARAAKQENGSYSVFILNMSNRPVPVTLKFDGITYTSTYNVEYLAFNSLIDNPIWEKDEYPLKSDGIVNDNLVLRPYSITKLSDISF